MYLLYVCSKCLRECHMPFFFLHNIFTIFTNIFDRGNNHPLDAINMAGIAQLFSFGSLGVSPDVGLRPNK